MFVTHHVRPAPGAPRLVLLHGVFVDHHLWDPVLPLLDGLDVHALDSPGHGRATRTAPLPPLDAQVDELAATLAEPAVLAGHSWGGMLALRLARRRPELVRGLLLTNTPLLRTRATAGFRAQRALLSAGLPASIYGRVAATSLYGAGYRRAHPGVVADTGRTTGLLGHRGAAEVITRILLEPGDATGLLRGLDVPTVLVAGEGDYVGTAEHRAQVAAAGHELLAHPGGHMGPREAPEHLARLLRDLLARAG